MSALHVLIVEDSLIYRRLLSRMLTQWGYIVSEAENGVAALEILSSQPISMVISDWEMPEMDGLTLCQTIRSRQFGRAASRRKRAAGQARNGHQILCDVRC